MSEIIPRINEMDDFLYEFKDILQRKCILTAPITVPLQISVHEYACRLIQAYSIPCYLEQGKYMSKICFILMMKIQYD